MSKLNRFDNFAGRVSYAAQVITSGRDCTRAFDNCFENFDGKAVTAALMRRAEKNEKLRANIFRYLGKEEAVACFNRLKGQNLTQVARQLRAEGQARCDAQWAEARQKQEARNAAAAPTAIATELTPAGEQAVIPGCEANKSPKAKQLSLWG